MRGAPTASPPDACRGITDGGHTREIPSRHVKAGDRWCDFSSTVNLARVKAAGYAGICRYLCWLPNSKVINAAEYAQAMKLGLEVRLVWEFNADDTCTGGAAAGARMSAEANRQADVLGYPKNFPIYYAADHDCVPAHWAACEAFLRACRGRPAGLYGPAGVVDHMLARGAARAGWQAGASTAWYGNQAVSGHAHLYQRARPTLPAVGGAIDENIVLRPDIAATPDPTSAPQPAPAPVLEDEDDMKIITESSGASWLLVNGKAIGIETQSVIDALKAGGVEQIKFAAADTPFASALVASSSAVIPAQP